MVVPLRSFVRGRLGTDEDSEDIVQEVFTRLARMDTLKTKLSDTETRNRAYMFTIANNLIVDNERRKVLQKNYNSQLNNEKIQEITPEEIVFADRQLDVFKRAILEMKPTWRQAFVLNRFKFMSYPQIAAHMGVTIKQVENYMNWSGYTNSSIKLLDACVEMLKKGEWVDMANRDQLYFSEGDVQVYCSSKAL